MASSRQVLLLAVVATVACLVSLASGTQWIVGDEGGWRENFNQTGWTDGKTFVVGDSLQFVYPKGDHNVIRVGEGAFAACNLSANLQLANWTTGNDVVPLDTQGKIWFICSIPDHCLNGMKLAIDVVDGGTTGPAPSPWAFSFPPAPAPAPPPFPGVPAPASPPTAPPSAAVRNPVGCAVAVVAAAVVTAALAF